MYSEMPGYNVQAVERKAGVYWSPRKEFPGRIQAVYIRQAVSRGVDLFIPAGNLVGRLSNVNSVFSFVSRNKSTQKFHQPAPFRSIFLRNRSR